jgi:hypothetical protein
MLKIAGGIVLSFLILAAISSPFIWLATGVTGLC